MAIVNLKSEYERELADVYDYKTRIADWENALSGLKNTYETAYESDASGVKKQAAYDISQAYENYKKTQLNVLQNQYLTSGSKAAVLSEMGSDYSDKTRLVRAQETSQLGKLQQQYESEYHKAYENTYEKARKDVEDFEKTISEEAGKIEDIERAIYEYMGTDFTTAHDESAGLYKLNKETGAYELTTQGRDFFAKALLQANQVVTETEEASDAMAAQHFADYLYETDKDLYDYFVANRGLVGSLVGGISQEDWRTTYADSSAVKAVADELQTTITDKYATLTEGQKQQLQTMNATLDAIVSKDYSTQSERRKAYDEYLATLNDLPTDIVSKGAVEKPKDTTKNAFSSQTYSYRGEQYAGTFIRNTTPVARNITNDLDLKKRIKSGEISYGDVVEWKGNYYVVEKGDNKIPHFTKLTKK